MRLVGERAHVASEYSGTQIYDVKDPRAPVLVGRQPRTEVPAEMLEASETVTLVACNWGRGCRFPYAARLDVLDVEHLRHPLLVGSLAVGSGSYGLRNVVASGDLAHLTDYYGSFYVVDVGDPSRPTEIGRLPGAFSGEPEMAVSGDLVGAVVHHLVKLIDVGDPRDPAIVSEFWAGMLVRRIELDSDRLVVADEDSLRVFDVGDPVTPQFLGTHELEGTAPDIAMSGDALYVVERGAGYRAHLVVIDPRPSSGPVANGDVWLEGGSPAAVAARGDGYVVVANWRLSVVDVRDPQAPIIVGSTELPDYSVDVVSDGRRAWVQGQTGEVRVVDLGDPTKPRVSGIVYRGVHRQELGLAARNGHLLVADDLFHVLGSNPPVENAWVTSACEAEVSIPAEFEPGHYEITIANESCDRTGSAGVRLTDRADSRPVREPVDVLKPPRD